MVTVAKVAAGGACLWLLLALFFGGMGLPRYLTMRTHVTQLEGELASLRGENVSLRGDIAKLQHDPSKIERLARERLGYVRKGETVYQLAPDSSSKQEHPARP